MEQPRSCTIQVNGDAIDTAQDLEAADARLAEQQRRNEMYLARLTPEQRAELERVLQERATPPPGQVERVRMQWRLRRSQKCAAAGLALLGDTRTDCRPREALPKMRGSTRRSSARSGDSGEDGPSDPASRPVDQLLLGLRELAFEYGLERIYELIPGEGDQPDRWKAKCPVHPDVSAYTLLITELPDDGCDVWCSVGCDPGAIWRILVRDREREALAAHYAEVLLWAQSYKDRRAA